MRISTSASAAAPSGPCPSPAPPAPPAGRRQQPGLGQGRDLRRREGAVLVQPGAALPGQRGHVRGGVQAV
ncbi:hypothetical protein ACFQU7_15110 [Pseudoroseomonas wenyumeiae]